MSNAFLDAQASIPTLLIARFIMSFFTPLGAVGYSDWWHFAVYGALLCVFVTFIYLYTNVQPFSLPGVAVFHFHWVCVVAGVWCFCLCLLIFIRSCFLLVLFFPGLWCGSLADDSFGFLRIIKLKPMYVTWWHSLEIWSIIRPTILVLRMCFIWFAWIMSRRHPAHLNPMAGMSIHYVLSWVAWPLYV